MAEERLIPPAEQSEWNAVGRVNIGGLDTEMTCTGTLIAPDLVLTAAHCVVALQGAAPDDLAQLMFIAGWNNGEYAATGTAEELLFPPGYAPGPLRRSNIARDIAVIRLAAPLDAPLMRTGVVPDGAAPLGIVSYANSTRHAPTLRTDCLHVMPVPRVIFLSCPVFSGNSGAPILGGLPDAPYLVGVVSARGLGGAYGATLNAWLRSLLAQARSAP